MTENTTELDGNTEDKPHPPVPPSNHMRVRELDEKGSRIIERKPQETPCPMCEGELVYFEEATGKMMMAAWDPDMFDSDEYELAVTYERHDRYHECRQCGWRIDI